MKKLLTLSVLLFLSASCFSQKGKGTYDWGVGLKYQPAAISIKKYTSRGDALEMLLIKYDDGIRATILAELCPNITMSKSLRIVIGPGLHIGAQKKKNQLKDENNPIIGLDGILGMEWKLPKIPFAIQADLQPSVDIFGNSDFFTNWGGLTVKYTW